MATNNTYTWEMCKCKIFNKWIFCILTNDQWINTIIILNYTSLVKFIDYFELPVKISHVDEVIDTSKKKEFSIWDVMGVMFALYEKKVS